MTSPYAVNKSTVSSSHHWASLTHKQKTRKRRESSIVDKKSSSSNLKWKGKRVDTVGIIVVSAKPTSIYFTTSPMTTIYPYCPSWVGNHPAIPKGRQGR